MSLSDAELERYARHIVMREIGGPGQAALQERTVESGSRRPSSNCAASIHDDDLRREATDVRLVVADEERGNLPFLE